MLRINSVARPKRPRDTLPGPLTAGQLLQLPAVAGDGSPTTARVSGLVKGVWVGRYELEPVRVVSREPTAECRGSETEFFVSFFYNMSVFSRRCWYILYL